jgi:hypothetical protein
MFQAFSKAKLNDGMHKAWFKVLFNPVLTKFGWIIVSHFDDSNKLLGYSFYEYPEQCQGPFRVWIKLRRNK